MAGKALKYGAVLIGTYLALAYATGFGKDLTALTALVTKTTKTLQARA